MSGRRFGGLEQLIYGKQFHIAHGECQQFEKDIENFVVGRPSRHEKQGRLEILQDLWAEFDFYRRQASICALQDEAANRRARLHEKKPSTFLRIKQ